MKITLLAVGSCKKEEGLLVERYKLRINKWRLETLEVADSLKQEEQEKRLSNIISKLDEHWVLDSQGETFSSEDFAKQVREAMVRGSLGISIGGSYGFSAEFKKKANRRLSFGLSTFSHQLVRVMLMEQLYRAQCISFNHPYHH